MTWSDSAEGPRPSQQAFLVVGGVCGLTWAAALRGWMVQLVGAEQSTVTWLTVVLVLLPGLLTGVLLGCAAFLRSTGTPASRWLIFSPVVFASALLDPAILAALFRNGEGSGSLMVVATALAAGFALSRRRWSVAGVASGVVALLGLLMLGAIGSMTAPMDSPRGAWASLLGLSLVLLLCLAAVLPYPPVRPALGVWSLVALGGVCGFAWSASLRSFMAQVAGAGSTVEWLGTFGYVLLPGVVVGAVLGLAEHHRRTGGRRHGRWLAAAPFLFAAVLVGGLVQDPSTVFDGGIGAGALALPVLALVGGHALSGTGPRWSRSLASLLGVVALAAWPVVGTLVGGPAFEVTSPHGLWAAILYDGLLVLLALAVSVPLRTPAGRGRPVAVSSLDSDGGAVEVPLAVTPRAVG
jgi:hypothetical protein